MKPAVVFFGEANRPLAGRIAAAIDGEAMLAGPNGEAAQALLPRVFAEGRPIVGICAAGILIRLLAPALADKTTEPPVLAVSADGQSVVPLLGGHHGANALARQLAELLEGHAAVTTASDTRFSRGLDEPPEGWVLADAAAAKPAMAAVLNGASLRIEGEADWLAEAGYPVSPDGAVTVSATEQVNATGLVYHPRTLVAGIGSERGVEAAEVIGLIEATLASANLSPMSLACLASVELKADEAAFHAAASHFGVPLRLFSAAELEAERGRLANPSAAVETSIGIPGVAEAAALKAGALLVEKRKSARATCAIGRAPQPVVVAQFGRAPGLVHLVGIGPGDAPSRTAAILDALASSTDWVGYGLYLDLVGDLRREQAEHRFPLGEEEHRVRHALELAAKGRTVSLICSGDAQIYAMAALAYELLEATGERALSDAARRVGLVTHPGISAFQAASAAAGALIGHDFCCISLSDLLTPRADIESRLDGAARADFVTALYNPRSLRRTDLLDEAKRIFLAHRPPDTPVIVAASLGRPEQKVRVVRLDAFTPSEVDMLTIVIFGASTSRSFARAGRTVAYTPRGYARKHLP